MLRPKTDGVLQIFFLLSDFIVIMEAPERQVPTSTSRWQHQTTGGGKKSTSWLGS